MMVQFEVHNVPSVLLAAEHLFLFCVSSAAIYIAGFISVQALFEMLHNVSSALEPL